MSEGKVLRALKIGLFPMVVMNLVLNATMAGVMPIMAIKSTDDKSDCQLMITNDQTTEKSIIFGMTVVCLLAHSVGVMAAAYRHFCLLVAFVVLTAIAIVVTLVVNIYKIPSQWPGMAIYGQLLMVSMAMDFIILGLTIIFIYKIRVSRGVHPTAVRNSSLDIPMRTNPYYLSCTHCGLRRDSDCIA